MDLHKMVSMLSKKELVELVMDLTDGDEDVAKKVEYKLSTPHDEVKASKQLIRQYINENKRRGFISWRNVHAALRGAEMVLEKGRNKLVSGEEELAVRLGITVLSIVIDMLQYTDDSGGEIGYIVNESMTMLKDASSLVLLSTEHREQDRIFQLILDEALHKRYDGWNDIRHELLEVCTIYTARASARKKLESTLEKLLTKVSSISSWSSDYDQKSIKMLQLKVLERNGELEKAQKFINENLKFDEFREMAIEKDMANEQFTSALKLCEDGEENDSKYPGLVKKWKQYRLQIYEALEDLDKQKEILREFVFDNDYESYNKLKEFYSPEEWQPVVDEIFTELEEKSDHLPYIYEYMAKAEEREDKILKYCEESPITVLELYPYLLDGYAAKVDEIFTSFLKSEAEQASDRKQYRSVCKKLEIYHKACGETKFRGIVEELKETYNRKPAFVNELEKVERLFG
ncbi:hypothetical protein M3182_24435 [Mesobacillus maritimus]|uniref:DUF6880 family protein n=1 Tax=Mesobacillus maritimus TaxID=1643336 RepID=UPI00203CC469|nr:DUF6880 family protein [Mesobacillus maritimus]MCM3588782.1 hypothetical protein [Mesobacillus maritimus]MCM3671906.1 hypothetical protein [Mesobacillus maritimus]